ncbi:MAG: AMP-binding protein [Haliea sp.]|jgi:acyl-CoA synthetase (AMP-forming)/AMP-acid ligase II|nr:AMP-binding protein [Haliea sp.]
MRIIDYFDNGVKYYPDNLAFVDVDRQGLSMTYAEAKPHTERIAGAIRGNGYGKGAHVGILAPNSTVAFLALLGLFRAESVWLPINPRNTPATNIDLLTRFDGELLLYHSEFEEQAREILDSVPNIREAICIDAPEEASNSLAAWSAGCPDTHVPGPADMDETFAIFPTGGTTGKSKGVVMNQRSIYTLYQNFYAHFNYHDDSCHLVVAPMTHTAGITGCMHFARGGTNAIMSKAAPDLIADAIEKHRVTHLFLPPTVVYMMLALPDVRERDYSSLQHLLVGAAPTSLEKLKEAITVFGPVMTEAFGQSEAPASITAKAPWDYLDREGNINERRLASIGRPCVNNTVAILDEQGQEVARGESGEICIVGELVTPGYYKNPEATAEARQFGWHHTGDIGVMDEEGFITIVDRKKDMIITGGFNVFPNEVEQVLTTHPAVQDCAVIGVPDEKWGEAVKAVVQLKPGQGCDDQELIALCKDELGSVKAPKSVDFVDDLPRSAAGKVLKTDLRKTYWEGRERAVN